MRILVVSYFFPPLIGGAERIAEAGVCALLDRGHFVTLITATDRINERLLRRSNFEVICEQLLHPGREDKDLPESAATRLESVVAAGKFDVVHSHLLTYPWVKRRSLSLLKLFAKYSLPVYDQAHGGDPETDPIWCIQLMQYAAGLVADSHYVEERLTRMFLAHKARYDELRHDEAKLPSIRLLYPRITEPEVFYPSLELRQAQRAELGVGDEFVTFFPSRCLDVRGELSTRKRPLDAIRGFAAFLKKFKRARFVAPLPPGFLPGEMENESRKRINALATQLGSDRASAFIEKAASAAMMNRLYNAADVVLVPSVEGFGLVYVESMATCTPVVTLKEGAGREVLGSEAAIFLEDGHALQDEIGSALFRLATSEQLAARMGEAGRRRYEELLQPIGWVNEMEKLLAGTVGGDAILP